MKLRAAAAVAAMLALAVFGARQVYLPGGPLVPDPAIGRLLPGAWAVTKLWIADDGPAAFYWFPHAQAEAAGRLVTMLSHARPAAGRLPQPRVVFMDNTNPSTLELQLQRGVLTVMPDCAMRQAGPSGPNGTPYGLHCLRGILALRFGSRIFYARDPSLYAWLRRDAYKRDGHWSIAMLPSSGG